jgi:hypothetical protein
LLKLPRVAPCYNTLARVCGADLGGVFDGMKISVDGIVIKSLFLCNLLE